VVKTDFTGSGSLVGGYFLGVNTLNYSELGRQSADLRHLLKIDLYYPVY